MIQSKADFKRYMKEDMPFYKNLSRKDRFLYVLTKDPLYLIAKYVRFLRKEEYYSNVRHDVIGKLLRLYYFRKKNALGNVLGFKIPQNCFGEGLMIYHHGCIIVNENVSVGARCKLHGTNCIGNNGKTGNALSAGDDLDVGIGACIIGDIRLGDRVTVGANAVVTKSFEQNGITLIGMPARMK